MKWAQVLAQLSLRYSNLIDWTIDDFEGSNLVDPFTPDYVKQMQKAARKINPKFTFKPIVYSYTVSNDFARKYGPYIDGIIFPYKGFYEVKSLQNQLDRIAELFRTKTVVLMVYATKHSSTIYPPPTSYVHNALQIGLNYKYKKHWKLAGVTAYYLKISPKKEPCGALSHGLIFYKNMYTLAPNGTYAKVSQEVKT